MIVDPYYSAERKNKLIEQLVERYKRTARLYLKSRWQSKMLPGQVPPTKQEEWLGLMQQHERNAAMMTDAGTPQGNRVRAQRAEMRLVQLTEELMANEQTAQS